RRRVRARPGRARRGERADPLALPARPGRQPGRAVRADLTDELLEGAAARLEVLELVEARARRRQQHDLVGPRRGARRGHRALEVAAVARGAAEHVTERGRRLADEVDAGAPGPDGLAQ